MPATTHAAARYRGGKRLDVVQVESRPPGPDEVAIRVAWCGICGTDLHVFHGHMDARVGDRRVLGHEMSGTVAAIGERCTGVAPGDRVVVRPLAACGECPACAAGHAHICHHLRFLGLDTDGAMQEVWNVPRHTVHGVPEGLRLDLAALVEPLAVACHDVRLSALQPGEEVVVIGGGPIGLLVALVARAEGGNVLVSEVNPHRRTLAASLGLDTVDPDAGALAEEVGRRTGGAGAAVVFEVSGSQAGVDAMTEVAATRGRIVVVAIHPQRMQVDLFRCFWRELRLLGARVYEPEDYERALARLADGGIDPAPLITDIRPLAEMQTAFESLVASPTAMKCLIRVGGEM